MAAVIVVVVVYKLYMVVYCMVDVGGGAILPPTRWRWASRSRERVDECCQRQYGTMDRIVQYVQDTYGCTVTALYSVYSTWGTRRRPSAGALH